MKLFISLIKFNIFIMLIIIAPNVYAEYYLQTSPSTPNLTLIDCRDGHCRWQTHHARKYHHQSHRCYHREIDSDCDQDMATGDDNACLHPEMQIN